MRLSARRGWSFRRVQNLAKQPTGIPTRRCRAVTVADFSQEEVVARGVVICAMSATGVDRFSLRRKLSLAPLFLQYP